MSRILLLGGNGLLGHNVLKQLLQQGHDVHALLRNVSALCLSPHERGKANQEGKPTQLTIFQGSLLDDETLRKAAQGCDTIVNCAGVTDMSLLHYEDYLPVNRDLCGRLLRLMEEEQIKCLVHTSTANTIGYGDPLHCADEQAPMQPPFTNSYYALSKQEGEAVLAQAAASHPDWHIVVVNPGFMVGAYDTKPSSGTLLFAGYRKPLMVAPRGGKSFVHVGDAATAIVNALTLGHNGGRYLLTGENLSLQQFYRLQARACGYRQWVIPLPNVLLALAGKLGDILRFFGVRTQLSTRNVRQLMVREYYDNSQALTDLHMPQTSIENAISAFFAWQEKKKRGLC